MRVVFNHMVEYTSQLDIIFRALGDPTRRDILTRLQRVELSVSDLAEPYSMSLAAVSKHLKILERAQLIHKRKQGRERYVVLVPGAMRQVAEYMRQYEVLWSERFDTLELIVEEDASG